MSDEGIPEGMGGLMQQATMLQQQMKTAQERAARKHVVGESGGGLVKVTVSGALEVIRVEIDPAVVTGEDVSMLEDLVAAAIRDGMNRARDLVSAEMGPLAHALKAAGLGGF